MHVNDESPHSKPARLINLQHININPMKKYFITLVMFLSAALVQAQEVSTQTGTSQPGAAEQSVNTLFILLAVTGVSLFLFLIIYSLSKAVKALSTQTDR